MRSLISFLEYLLGIPMEIKDRYGGLMPFADKSLTQETMLFLAICQGFIPVGTSVFSTSISHFNMILIGQKILFLLVFVFVFASFRENTATSSFPNSVIVLSGLSLDIKRSIISFSFNLVICKLNFFSCLLVQRLYICLFGFY